jgi:hypothetical protein
MFESAVIGTAKYNKSQTEVIVQAFVCRSLKYVSDKVRYRERERERESVHACV